LQRMKTRGWVRSEWRTTDNNRRARYYAITTLGRKQLDRERAAWLKSSVAVNQVLDWAEAGT
jgi:PadR family transcriptional regulator PadR